MLISPASTRTTPPQLRTWRLGEKIIPDYSSAKILGYDYFWYCRGCGIRYATVTRNHERESWQAIAGICPHCTHREDRYNVAGSIEALCTIGWDFPKAVLEYQLNCELSYHERQNPNDHPLDLLPPRV